MPAMYGGWGSLLSTPQGECSHLLPLRHCPASRRQISVRNFLPSSRMWPLDYEDKETLLPAIIRNYVIRAVQRLLAIKDSALHSIETRVICRSLYYKSGWSTFSSLSAADTQANKIWRPVWRRWFWALASCARIRCLRAPRTACPMREAAATAVPAPPVPPICYARTRRRSRDWWWTTETRASTTVSAPPLEQTGRCVEEIGWNELYSICLVLASLCNFIYFLQPTYFELGLNRGVKKRGIMSKTGKVCSIHRLSYIYCTTSTAYTDIAAIYQLIFIYSEFHQNV